MAKTIHTVGIYGQNCTNCGDTWPKLYTLSGYMAKTKQAVGMVGQTGKVIHHIYHICTTVATYCDEQK